MPAPRRILRRLAAVLALAAALVAPARTSGGDPFQPGSRWTHAAPGAAPWIPRDVAFAARGELVWAAPAVGSPHLVLLAAGGCGGAASVLFEDHRVAQAVGPIEVAAGDDADELFSLVQYPAPDSSHRRSVLGRHDPYAASRGSAFAPAWSRELGPRSDGPARLAAAADGARVATALHDRLRGRLQVDWFDGHTGTRLRRERVPATGVHSLALSADGRTLAVLSVDRLYVLALEEDAARLVADVPGGSALALEPDGSSVAVGLGGRVLTWEDGPGGFSPGPEHPGRPGEVAVRAALAGGTLAVAWWEASSGDGVRCELVDSTSGAVLAEHAQQGSPAGLQNYPAALELTADGARAAFGLWGTGDGRPEVVLLAAGESDPVLVQSLPGSVQCLALDATGTRIAVGAKDAHANHFATTGSLLALDTGERRLQSLGPARPGGSVDLVYASEPDVRVIFGLGSPAALPGAHPFATGTLLLDLTRPHVTRGTDADGLGRAFLSLPLGPGLELVGFPLLVQAAALEGGAVRLSERAVRPPVF